jgi:site-specific DNA-cytosine methylase
MTWLYVPPFNYVEVCAGVGGLGLGLELAVPGARGIAYVERETYAAATLAARMEEGALDPAPIWSDLGTFDARSWRGVVDCLVSGDPCQPNSVAGKRGGSSDDRWLIDQVLRVVDECRPHSFFRENVTGNADGQLEALIPALEAMGGRVAAGIFSAAEVGASHRRERLFILADFDGWGCGGLGEPGSARVQSQPGNQPHRCDGEGSAVADADGRRGAGRESQHGRELGFYSEGNEAGRRDEGMVVTSSKRRGEGIAEPELQRGREAAGEPSGPMADANGPRHASRRSGARRALRDGSRRSQSDGRGLGLADASDGQLQKPRRGSEGRDGSGSASPALGDAAGDGASFEAERRRPRGPVGEPSPELADAGCLGGERSGTTGHMESAPDAAEGALQQRQRGGSAADDCRPGSSEPVADANGTEREGGGGQPGGRSESSDGSLGMAGSTEAGRRRDSAGGMADAGDAGLQGGEFGGACDDDRDGPDAHGSASELRGTFIFAPGPGDPVWPQIIAADPLLSPAISKLDFWAVARRNLGLPPLVGALGRRGGMARDLDPVTTARLKSEVRRIVDGMGSRVDRLRASGNGVFPLAAAVAYLSLRLKLAEDRAARLAILRAA